MNFCEFICDAVNDVGPGRSSRVSTNHNSPIKLDRHNCCSQIGWNTSKRSFILNFSQKIRKYAMSLPISTHYFSRLARKIRYHKLTWSRMWCSLSHWWSGRHKWIMWIFNSKWHYKNLNVLRKFRFRKCLKEYQCSRKFELKVAVQGRW